MVCERCLHRRAVAFVPLIIRWGPGASSDILRRSARCRAEALSGLARAFFYAGARALLVSHWAVYSDATVKLVTGAVARMAADRGIGRAEAMRQSMLELIDKGSTEETQPAFWAPFVVVGEGAAAK